MSKAIIAELLLRELELGLELSLELELELGWS